MHGKYQRLLAIIRDMGHVAVAYSGGVDSTLLLKAATEVLGAEVTALFVNSVLQKSSVAERVQQSCRNLGCTLQIVDINPLNWPDFVENSARRCYYCKQRIYKKLIHLLPRNCILVDGTNVDDLEQDRPGLQAIAELEVQTPLVKAEFAKKEIRSISRELGLVSWNVPSESCLATRVKTGIKITPILLSVVEQGEKFLADKGFHGCRVRLDNQSVFISLTQGDRIRFVENAIIEEVVKFFAKRKFGKVFLDLSERESILF